MDDPLLSASKWLFRVSVFAVFFCLFVCENSRIYPAGTKGEKNFPSRMEEIGIRESDG